VVVSEGFAREEGCEAARDVAMLIPARAEYLCVVRAAFAKMAEVVGFCCEEAERLTLALEEALTNAIRHSYGGPCERPISVKMHRVGCGAGRGEALEVVVRDYGRQVDPATIKGRDLDKVEPGGLGVHIIRSLMDEVEYSRGERCGMQLRMVKYVPARAVEEETDQSAGSGL